MNDHNKYSTLSFKALKTIYDIHSRLMMECPESLSEGDFVERHEIAMELDRRLEKGETK